MLTKITDFWGMDTLPFFFQMNFKIEKKIEVSLHFYDFNMHDLLINVYHVPL